MLWTKGNRYTEDPLKHSQGDPSPCRQLPHVTGNGVGKGRGATARKKAACPCCSAPVEDDAHLLAGSQREIQSAIKTFDTARLLRVVFDRLYVLRNQLVHGGATWNGKVNRQQVRDGAAVLAWMLPIFIDIMMDNPGHAWGKPYYPVVD